MALVESTYLRRTPNPIKNGGLVCTHDADRVIEETCTATYTYECPCGISMVTLPSSGHHQAAQYRLQ